MTNVALGVTLGAFLNTFSGLGWGLSLFTHAEAVTMSGRTTGVTKKGVVMDNVRMQDVRTQIMSLLMETRRENMLDMVDWLIANGFFESPASTRFHNSFEGGLAEHSLGVYKLLTAYSKKWSPPPAPGQITLPVVEANLIIAGLLHDVCKVGAYLGASSPYKWNRAQPKGHALLSLIRIAKYIEIKPIEEMMIKFHMGPYGTLEFDVRSGEYHMRGDDTKSKEERYGQSLANAWYHNPIVKLIYFCDELEMSQKGGS